MSSAAGINEFIIDDSFQGDAVMDSHRDGRGPQQDFVQDVDVIDGDFAPVRNAKAKKRKILAVSLTVVGLLGASAIVAIQLNAGMGKSSAFPLDAAGGPVGAKLTQTAPGQLPVVAPVPPEAILPATTAVSVPGAAVANGAQAAVLSAPQAVEPSVAPAIVPAASPAAPVVPVASQPASAIVDKASVSVSTPPLKPNVEAQPSIQPVVAQPPQASPFIAQAVAKAAPTQETPKAQPKPVVKKLEAPKKPELAKVAKPTPPSQKPEAQPADAGEVKPLVTMTGAAIGLRFFTADALSVAAMGADKPTTFRVGDSLPSGERIKHLDPSSMTIVTDRRVIRIN